MGSQRNRQDWVTITFTGPFEGYTISYPLIQIQGIFHKVVPICLCDARNKYRAWYWTGTQCLLIEWITKWRLDLLALQIHLECPQSGSFLMYFSSYFWPFASLWSPALCCFWCSLLFPPSLKRLRLSAGNPYYSFLFPNTLFEKTNLHLKPCFSFSLTLYSCWRTLMAFSPITQRLSPSVSQSIICLFFPHFQMFKNLLFHL